MGIGDWGLGIGPNPQSPLFLFKIRLLNYFLFNLINIKIKIIKIKNYLISY
jgi:hypothetical protein